MKSNNKKLISLVIVLSVIVLALSGFIYYNNAINDTAECIGPIFCQNN